MSESKQEKLSMELSGEVNDSLSDNSNISKRALKKQKKRQAWLDSKQERRAKEKAKRKAKIEKRKAENPDINLSYSESRKRLKKSLGEKTPCGRQVVFDMSFGHLMNQRDRGKCLKQVMHCYSINRRLHHPFNLYATSFDGVMKEEMSKHSGYMNWTMFSFLPEHFTSLVDAPNSDIKSKSDLVYLSSESENVIDSFDKGKLYIIGGLVDHNLHKGLCYSLAKEAGIQTARLPLDEHVDLKTRRVLTIDHVFQIIGNVVSEEMTWKDAVMKTLPPRKGASAKESNNDAASAENSLCIEGQTMSDDQEAKKINSTNEDTKDSDFKMVKGKIGSKAAEKKKERIEMQRKMDARLVYVNAANKQMDPLASLPSFKKFNKNGLEVTLSTERVTDLNEKEQNAIIDLIVRNMKALYEESNWGWNEKNKRDEMLDDAAWYLMARNEKGELCGYSHFRYDMDFDDEVLYVYEIQLEEKFRRKGLGKFMMQVLEMLAFKADMRKIMLTVLKHNPAAKSFFKNQMKFEIDETCPADDVYEQFDYEILSKFNKRKLAREAAEAKE